MKETEHMGLVVKQLNMFTGKWDVVYDEDLEKYLAQPDIEHEGGVLCPSCRILTDHITWYKEGTDCMMMVDHCPNCWENFIYEPMTDDLEACEEEDELEHPTAAELAPYYDRPLFPLPQGWSESHRQPEIDIDLRNLYLQEIYSNIKNPRKK